MTREAHNGLAVECRAVTYRLPTGVTLLSGLDLQVAQGETLVLLGRSGSGKTTTLKLINRLLEPSEGKVLISGKPSTQWNPVMLRRGIGYVIQDAGLFPHWSVQQNVALVPRLEGWAEDKIQRRLNEVMALVGLPMAEFGLRRPSELSGGQRQRVGVARALAGDPPILLMDEPFGALDPVTRAELQREFRALSLRLGKAIVFVTHDVREALFLGTRIAFLAQGRLVAVHTPGDFLRATEPEVRAFVASLDPGGREEVQR